MRKSQIRIPRRARERGIPTAQPTIMGILDELELDVEDGGGEPWVWEDAGGVIIEVWTTVTMPVLPVEREVWTEVIGVEGPVGAELD